MTTRSCPTPTPLRFRAKLLKRGLSRPTPAAARHDHDACGCNHRRPARVHKGLRLQERNLSGLTKSALQMERRLFRAKPTERLRAEIGAQTLDARKGWSSILCCPSRSAPAGSRTRASDRGRCRPEPDDARLRLNVLSLPSKFRSAKSAAAARCVPTLGAASVRERRVTYRKDPESSCPKLTGRAESGISRRFSARACTRRESP